MRTPGRSLLLAVSVAPLLGLVGLGAGCKGCDHSVPARVALGKTSDVSEVSFGPYITTAHAIIRHEPEPAPPPPERPGVRVFVTWWSPGKPPVRGTGLGPTLLESVRIASQEVAKTAEGPGRVELETVVDSGSGSPESDAKMSARQMGLYGYVAFDDNLNFGWVTPSEMIQSKFIDAREDKPTRLKTSELWYLLRQRAGVTNQAVKRMTRLHIKVDQRLESLVPGEEPIRLFRSMPLHATTLSADQVFAAVRAAADYIARVCDDKGRFVYVYEPDNDTTEKGYSIIRHAGAIYALMDAYSEMHEETWRAAADRAIDYLIHEFKTSPDGVWIDQTEKEEQQKVGGAGLSLVALAKYTEATGDRRHLETMRELARFIVHQEYPDGHFRANVDVMAEKPDADPKSFKKEVTYYSGEGVLGLIRLYALDPDPKWLDAAKKAADYLINVRDGQLDDKHQIHDHWMSYALLDLYGVTKDARYADHSFKIARAILQAEIRTPKPSEADYLGAFYDKGATTPCSTRLEALATQIQLSRVMGKDEEWLRGPAMDIARFTIGQQMTGDALYFAENPDRARGGVRESLLSSDVRIDYPQHALSGWLRFARELRDPAWGKASK